MIWSKINIGSVARPHSGDRVGYIIGTRQAEVNPLAGKNSCSTVQCLGIVARTLSRLLRRLCRVRHEGTEMLCISVGDVLP